MRERVLDVGADRRLPGVRPSRAPGHGLAPRLAPVDPADLAQALEVALVFRGAVGAVGPHVGGGVGAVDQALAQPGAVVGRGIGDLLPTDDAVPVVDRDVGFVAERGDRDVDPRCAVLGRLGLGDRHRPARVDVLLARLGRLLGPDLTGAFARLDRGLLAVGGALTRGGDQRRVDDLARHRQIARLRDRAVQAREQRVERPRTDQGLAEVPEGVGVRDRVARPQPAEAHPAQPVAHQVLGLLQRQAVQRLQHQHPELQHHVKGRTTAFAAIARTDGRVEVSTKQLEVDGRAELLQRIALRRQLPKAILDVPETRLLTRHPSPPTKPGSGDIESCRGLQRQQVSGGVQRYCNLTQRWVRGPDSGAFCGPRTLQRLEKWLITWLDQSNIPTRRRRLGECRLPSNLYGRAMLMPDPKFSQVLNGSSHVLRLA